MRNNARRTLASSNSIVLTVVKVLSLILLAGQVSQALAQQHCPTLSVSCPPSSTDRTIIFTAGPNVEGVSYEWTVDAGIINGGQGTPIITVIDVVGSVTATVHNTGCSNAASCTTRMSPFNAAPRNVDSFMFVARDDAKARLDNFAISLQSEPGATAYIIVTSKGREGQKQADFARNYLVNYRGIGTQRIETVIDQPDEKNGTRGVNKSKVELWIVPAGASPPQVKPNVPQSQPPQTAPATASPAKPPASPRSRTPRLQ
jgi:hypothetical protein